MGDGRILEEEAIARDTCNVVLKLAIAIYTWYGVVSNRISLKSHESSFLSLTSEVTGPRA